MPPQAIQKQIDTVYAIQEHNEFGRQRNALLFLPGKLSRWTCPWASIRGDGAGRVARCDEDRGQRARGRQSCAQQCDIQLSGELPKVSRSLRRAARCSGQSRRPCPSGACMCAATWCSTRSMAGPAADGCRTRWSMAMSTPVRSSSGSRATAIGGVGRARTGTWCLSAWSIRRKAMAVAAVHQGGADADGAREAVSWKWMPRANSSVRVPELRRDSVGHYVARRRNAGTDDSHCAFYIARPDVDTAASINAQLAQRQESDSDAGDLRAGCSDSCDAAAHGGDWD